MPRLRLQNRHHKLKTGESKLSFKRQRNFCNRLYKRARRKYYSSLNLKYINDNKTMDIPQNNDRILNQSNISDPVDAIMSKFSDHPSILYINKTIEKSSFNFKLCDLDEIKNEVLNLKD